ncbi:MAG: tetratricopeptide repeat protein [Phycisphaeraceae bacterium JB051]
MAIDFWEPLHDLSFDMIHFRLHWQFCLLLMAFLSLGITQTTQACAWDYDTIAMERQRFPEAHELIVGYFVRHSDAYYQWRIEDRQKTPLEQRTPAQYDDIAVAYDKLGESPKAIQTILEKIDRFPDQGVYESQANLGTFYIHNGELEKGLVHIKKAIEINPDAHFGREIYQQLLVEYVIKCRHVNGDKKLPLIKEPSLHTREHFGYFVAERLGHDFMDQSQFSKAAKGIKGMMRFGHYDSPILLEALGDLFSSGGRITDSKMLAARAYLKASYAIDDPEQKQIYRMKADEAIRMHEHISLERIEKDLKNELEQGKAFFTQIENDEAQWVRQGKNLDQEFEKKYYNTDIPSLKVHWGLFEGTSKWTLVFLILLVTSSLTILLMAFRKLYMMIKRYTTSVNQQPDAPSQT